MENLDIVFNGEEIDLFEIIKLPTVTKVRFFYLQRCYEISFNNLNYIIFVVRRSKIYTTRNRAMKGVCREVVYKSTVELFHKGIDKSFKENGLLRSKKVVVTLNEFEQAFVKCRANSLRPELYIRRLIHEQIQRERIGSLKYKWGFNNKKMESVLKIEESIIDKMIEDVRREQNTTSVASVRIWELKGRLEALSDVKKLLTSEL